MNAEWSPADEILTTAVRECVAALKLGRRVDRHVPPATIARALELAADDAAAVLPDERIHLGAVYERGWVA